MKTLYTPLLHQMSKLNTEIIQTPRKRGKPLSIDEKWMVIRVFSRCNDERQNAKTIKTVNPYQRTSDYTGVGRRQIIEIVTYFNLTGQVIPPAHCGNRITHTTSIPPAINARIREFIFDKHREGIAINSNHIQDLLHNILKRDIPKQTIRDHLRRMGFLYSRTKKKTRSLREDPTIRQQRHTYIYDIRRFRKAGYRAIYLDESFLHHYHGNQFSWFIDNDFLERPTGKGRRWCFIHATGEEGLIPNALRIFEAKKSTGDYHDMFNAKHFLEWWQMQLTPNLPSKCVIIVDRATYHIIPEEQITPSTMRKAELCDWLTKNKIKWEKHWLRPKLQEEVENKIDKTPLIEKLAKKQGHKVLFLPVHHPELNPIETVWAVVKNECGRLLRSGIKFKEVRIHLEKAFTKISAQTCQKLFDRIKQKENEYWKLDMEFDSHLGNGKE